MTSAIAPRGCSPPWRRPTLAASAAGLPGGTMPAGDGRPVGACRASTIIRLAWPDSQSGTFRAAPAAYKRPPAACLPPGFP